MTLSNQATTQLYVLPTFNNKLYVISTMNNQTLQIHNVMSEPFTLLLQKVIKFTHGFCKRLIHSTIDLITNFEGNNDVN